MAHEELKNLYEIDKQHSYTPWEWWDFYTPQFSDWISLYGPPSWNVNNIYRRKPDAPLWDDDEKEDIRRKVRSIIESKDFKKAIEDMFSSDEFKNLLSFEHSLDYAPPQPELIQGYTREQWQRIIDEGFLCEFSRNGVFWLNIGCLGKFDDEALRVEGKAFSLKGHNLFEHCRPLRIKGVRQPWFGGEECPVDTTTYVVATYKSGARELGYAGCQHWPNVTEFIEL